MDVHGFPLACFDDHVPPNAVAKYNKRCKSAVSASEL